MAEQTEQVLVDVTWQSDSTDLKNDLNTVSNTLGTLSNAITRTMGVSIQLRQSNLTLIRSVISLRDAKRELNRESRRMYDLDLQQAQLNVKMAERQRLLTARSGRYLDVQQANLAVKMAVRDVDTTQFGIDDKTRKNRENLFFAEQQLVLVQQQRRLMMIQLGAQMGIMFAQILAIVAVRNANIAAIVAEHAALSLGATLAVSLAAVGAAYLAVKALTPEMTKAPPAQTEVGEARKIVRGGLIEAHSGETIGRPNITTNNRNSRAVINIDARGMNADDMITKLKSRLLQNQVTRFYTPMGVS